ncbi:MAG: RsmD family RNA methyltransferase, partial [Firmicutes bacterium]|nr:RsmD family RNA methyltransferase [Bacillota bacterium]
MRIVAGEFKGRRIETPKGYDVRPTTEKVKEALFSMLSNLMEDSTCCDLFSGTGNLGLEAISRGAERCIFCDNSGESVRLIRKNIEYCRATDRAVLIPGGFEKCLKKMDEEGLKADIFFLDPP